jgi:hypothetical protein
MKWNRFKRLVSIAILCIMPGGWVILLAWAFVWAVRYGDQLAAYSRASYAEFCKRQEQEAKE